MIRTTTGCSRRGWIKCQGRFVSAPPLNRNVATNNAGGSSKGGPRIDLFAVVSGTPVLGCSTCDRPRRARLSQILELLEGVVLVLVSAIRPACMKRMRLPDAWRGGIRNPRRRCPRLALLSHVRTTNGHLVPLSADFSQRRLPSWHPAARNGHSHACEAAE